MLSCERVFVREAVIVASKCTSWGRAVSRWEEPRVALSRCPEDTVQRMGVNPCVCGKHHLHSISMTLVD